MELKVAVPTVQTQFQLQPGIHYMELKDIEVIDYVSVWVKFYRESITWSWKCFLGCWYNYASSIAFESITWSWKVPPVRGQAEGRRPQGIHYMELKDRQLPSRPAESRKNPLHGVESSIMSARTYKA